MGIVKSLAALIGLMAAAPSPVGAQGAAVASVPAPAPTPRLAGPDGWTIYGTPAMLKRDDAVPGAGSVIAAALPSPADPWTSGAVVPIPQALAAGQRITIAFWAKAAAAETVPLTFQAAAAPYTAFLSDRIALTPHWQRFVRSASAPAPLAAGTQALTLQLGQARSAVTLGPVAILDGAASPGQVDAAFATFHPNRVAEEVRMASTPGVVLAGTLRTPVGRGAGPFPLAIFFPGTGPWGRGGSSALMDRLLADGIATLAYDKRGIGASTGTYSEDMDGLTADAAAAVAAMRRRQDVDGSRIALVGHSQGGAIAPAVAAADPRIAAIVDLAGPVGDGLEMFGRYMHDQLIHSGHAEATVKPLVDAAVALIQARVDHAGTDVIARLHAAAIEGLIANGFTREQAGKALAGIDSDNIYKMAREHIASDLKSLRIPVLQVFGSLDPIVVAQGSAAAARAALAHNPKAEVVVLEGLSHWFQEGAKTGSAEESASLGPSAGSPRVVALVGDWLKRVLAPAPATMRQSGKRSPRETAASTR